MGADLSKDHPADLVQYRYPVGTVYARVSEDFVYNLVKALDLTFDMYKDAHPTMPWWAIKDAGVPPADAPFHPGAIKYFKEKGIWTADYQKWNDQQVANMKKLKAAWEKAVVEGQAKKMKSKKFRKYWLKIRAQVLGL